MESIAPEKATGKSICPFFRPARMEHNYPLTGVCAGLPRGLVMIPTIEEYRTRCSTDGHAACPIYLSNLGEGNLEDWWKTAHPPWALSPW